MNAKHFLKISRMLERKCGLFYTLWEMGRPVFSNRVKTACVRFNKSGKCIEFVFNKEFYNGLNWYERAFVVAHECLHVLLQHGKRMQELSDLESVNNTMDVVTNELLRSGFGFVRSRIRNWRKYCWISTVFKGKKVKRGMSFEYYYNRVPKNTEKKNAGSAGAKGVKSSRKPQLVDDHRYLEDFPYEEILREIFKEDPNEYEHFCERAGIEPMGMVMPVDYEEVKKQKKWEALIRRCSIRGEEFVDVEQWARVNRRFSLIGGNMLLPTTIEQEDTKLHKVDLWMFIDASGSCCYLRSKFFRLAKSVPENRFNVRLFSFDVRVHRLDPKKDEVIGGGGTNFSCIEFFIQNSMMQEKLRYPDAVFVITDGVGTDVSPAYPERWNWMLTPRMYRRYIPSKSHVHGISSFEYGVSTNRKTGAA